jgi:hypothetical protein
MGNKGFEAALAAVEMASLSKAVVGRSSLVVGKSGRTKRMQPTAGKPKIQSKRKR